MLPPFRQRRLGQEVLFTGSPRLIDRRTRDIGIYLHVPFCAVSCPYCDYPHTAERASTVYGTYVRAVRTEIRRQVRFRGTSVDTLYVGGGTPSQLSEAHLALLFEALREAFDCTTLREVTLEATPDDLSPSFLEALHEQGINRLSLGVQSYFEEDLRFLGRRHRARAAVRAVPLAHAAGFQNVSVDLLFGLPEQSPARWQATLEKAVQQAPAHVTLYRLTVEPGTALGRRVEAGAVQLPDADRTAAQYEQALDTLSAAGYRLYEQTHLACSGRQALHTRRYWRHETVLGFGPGAHSFFWNTEDEQDAALAVRRANAPPLGPYLQALSAGEEPPHTHEELSRAALVDEYIALRLRTARGLSLKRLKERYGHDLRLEYGATLNRLQAEGYVERSGDRLRPTRAGRLRLDALIASLGGGA